MVGDPRSERRHQQHQGPVVPPRLGEIYEISARRQRTRYRLIQGTVVAVAVAGVGLAMQVGGTDRSTDAAGETGSAATSAPATEPSVSELEDTSTTTVSRPESEDSTEVDGAQRCFLMTEDADFADWMTDGREAYFDTSPVPVTELETLASSWQVSFDEVKALVGLAARNDVTLEDGSIDEALNAWDQQGYTRDELAELADQWNITTISVKVLQFIDSADIDASLAECGLAPLDG